MSKRWLFLVCVGLCIAALWKGSIKPTRIGKYAYLPVSFFPFSESPLVQISMGGRSFRLLLDLGMTGSFCMDEKSVSALDQKICVEENGRGADASGKEYLAKVFEVPEVTMGQEVFKHAIVVEEPREMREAARINNCRNVADKLYGAFFDWAYDQIVAGCMGWRVFPEVSLFDLSNGAIYRAKYVKNLPVDLTSFLELPLEVSERGFMIELNTALGVKKFLLDTGATQSVLRENEKGGYRSYLKLGEYDFGSWVFLYYPMDASIPCDGVLGIEFFQKNTICLDAVNKKAYLRPLSSQK